MGYVGYTPLKQSLNKGIGHAWLNKDEELESNRRWGTLATTLLMMIWGLMSSDVGLTY